LPSSDVAASYDAYNSRHRKRPLSEEHMERLSRSGGAVAAGKRPPGITSGHGEAPSSAGKRKRGEDEASEERIRKIQRPVLAAPAPKPAPSVAAQPWRPFNREVDLELKPKWLNPQRLLGSAAALIASRFESARGARHFL